MILRCINHQPYIYIHRDNIKDNGDLSDGNDRNKDDIDDYSNEDDDDDDDDDDGIYANDNDGHDNDDDYEEEDNDEIGKVYKVIMRRITILMMLMLIMTVFVPCHDEEQNFGSLYKFETN